VRELHNVMERAAIVSQDRKLVVELGGMGPHGPTGKPFRTEAQMRDMVRINLIAALRETHGRIAGQSGAAALLGIKPTTLYSRIATLNITEADWA
jgi:transcriptional regulator of acetoin/glycerol metabolism